MLDINREISSLRQLPVFGNYLGTVLSLLQTGVNNVGLHLGADPSQTVPQPPKIQKFNVKTSGDGIVHATIEDHNSIQRGVHYFVEYQQLKAGAPAAFTQPHVEHLGASRSMRPMSLPASDDDGNPVHYIFRAYSQYPGGHPGEPIHFGGSTPTPVAPGGTSRMTLLASTGSGTAPSNGQRGGSGFGKVLFRDGSGL